MKSYFLLCSILLFNMVNGRILKRICPPPEDIPKCECWYFTISCRYLTDPNELKNLTKYLSNYEVKFFNIHNSVLMYLPKKLFVQFHIEYLRIQNSNILKFETDNGEEMFIGLERSLEEIYFYKINRMSWKWYTFNILQRLKLLEITMTNLKKIDDVFPKLLSLKTLKLRHNNIEYIHEYAFSNLINLEELDMSSNAINTIYRSLLPDPAKKLRVIDFKYNKIKAIPDDFFIRMPSLSAVNLEVNRIKYISPVMFQPMAEGQRFIVYLHKNDIDCCSNLTEIIQEDYMPFLQMSCGSPKSLRKKELHELELNILRKHCQLG
ncbi:connectin-like [Centruroides sculpturatus]|uniref:connectin-like n=1 Tax=Centruroides sculpturatus TaxID=218467 RepID=UPI000C6DC970|nr:connectin-like [Centruroides sculpturatus]